MPRPRSLLLAALLALAALPVLSPVLEAQVPRGRTPRKILFAGLGALVAGAAATAYIAAGEDRNGGGSCSSKSCVGVVTLGAGMLVGYMIGREYDQLYALRYRSGRPLSVDAEAIAIDREALGLAVRDTLVAVSGASGVQLVSTGPRGLRLLARRAGGVRGIAALDLSPSSGALAVGSPAGFYVFPPVTGPGLLVREGGTTAVAAADGRAYFAVGTRVESAPVNADTTRQWPGVDLGAAVHALHWDMARSILWAATDSAVLSLRPDGDSLLVTGRVATDAPVRNLDGSGTVLVGALGEAGLRAWDVSDPAAPAQRHEWRTARFVYDAAVVSPSRVLVAAGTEGMYVVDVSQPALSVIGLARELGFVTTIVLRGPHAFLLDRYGDQLKRIDASSL